MNKQIQQNKNINKPRDLVYWFSLFVPLSFCLFVLLYYGYGFYTLTTRTAENVKSVWWLPKECSSVSYSFCQSDEIYEYRISESDFLKSKQYQNNNFSKIGNCPIKMIRYRAILHGNRNHFLSEIYTLDSESQNEYSCFRIINNGFYSLKDSNGCILYFVFDRDQQKMYCYVNVSKGGILIDTTDPFSEYTRQGSQIVDIKKK
jgi:hypothetical protein